MGLGGAHEGVHWQESVTSLGLDLGFRVWDLS